MLSLYESDAMRAERNYVLPEGTRVEGERGAFYTVLSLLSNDTGQANIYTVEKDGRVYVLKLFFRKENEAENEAMLSQIAVLMRRGEASDAFVTPLDIIRHEGRVGYVMEYVSREYTDGVYLVNGIDGDIQNQVPFAVKLTVLYGIAEAVRALFDAGLAIMDLKLDNVKFDPVTGAVRILDIDTIVSDGARGFVIGTPGYMPPLVMRGEEDPDKYADCFALAVIIFQTLFRFHPFEGRAEEVELDEDRFEYLYALHPVFVFHPTDDSNRPTEACAMYERRYERYPAFFTDAFLRTFVYGLFENKEVRTSPEEWCHLIERLYESSFSCSVCAEEHFIEREDITLCEVCGEPLLKPLLLEGDKSVPLYLESELSEEQIWFGGSRDRIVFRVVKTEYNGKFGLETPLSSLRLLFDDGRLITFERGKTAPLFLGARYLFEDKEFSLRQI